MGWGGAMSVGRTEWRSVLGHTIKISGNQSLADFGNFILKIDLAQIVASDSTLRMKVTICSLPNDQSQN